MVRMRSPVRIWPAAPESTQLHWKLGAFCFSGSSRTGDLTRKARFDKNRRLPRAVSASSRQPRSGLVPCGNLASSSIVVAKSALRPRFFYTKSPSARFLASPLQHKPTSLGFVLVLRQKGFFRESGFFASVLFKNPATNFSRPTRRPTGGLKGRNIAQGLVQSKFFPRCFALDNVVTDFIGAFPSSIRFHFSHSVLSALKEQVIPETNNHALQKTNHSNFLYSSVRINSPRTFSTIPAHSKTAAITNTGSYTESPTLRPLYFAIAPTTVVSSQPESPSL